MTRSDTERALKLLLDLVGDSTSVVFSGRSLKIVLQKLEVQLKKTAQDRDGKLVSYWERELPALRQRLLQNGTKTRTTDFRDITIVTEQAALVATQACPDAPYLP